MTKAPTHPIVTPRIPAEAFPPSVYLAEEMEARGWNEGDLACRMGGDPTLNLLIVQLMLAVNDKALCLDHETAAGLSRAFGTSAELWLNLDRSWREHRSRETPND